jgi:putative Mn2+ efflux pump MntP
MTTVQLLSILAFAISSNFDNVGVGIAYGIKGTCIPFPPILSLPLLAAPEPFSQCL